MKTQSPVDSMKALCSRTLLPRIKIRLSAPIRVISALSAVGEL
jgi:hypothetical protein